MHVQATTGRHPLFSTPCHHQLGLKQASRRRAPCSNKRRRQLQTSCIADAGQYDYVVVGGGTAGCVLANRLTADGSKRVLVLEAGPVESNRTVSTPAGITRLFMSSLDWNLFSTKQKQLKEQELYLARGKLIGGSSCTNATLYHRGCAEDYDAWGVPGWGSSDILQWFNQAEDNSRGESKFHGIGGLMSVEDPRYQNQLFDQFFSAAKEVGIAENPDFNDWDQSQVGYGDFQVAQKRGVRADMYSRALKPVMGRSNLEVQGEAYITKLCFEKANGVTQAVGVEYAIGGADDTSTQCVSLVPGGEVLLCAGAIHSPAILMHSGIGPEKELRGLGIPVVKGVRGVGKNLQDHPACLSAFLLKPEYEKWAVTNHVYNNKGGIRKRALLNYLLFGKGPLATTGCDRGAFVSLKDSGAPDVQFRFPAGYALDPDGVSSYVKFGEMLEKGEAWPGGITFQVIGCRPKSIGSVSLSCNDPLKDPVIDIAFLSDSQGEDLATLREGLKLSRRMAASKAWSPYLESEGFPGTDKTSDADLDDYIKETIHSANALVGTCKMGASEVDGSVVDASLKVHGVDGLRVVDASVIPVIPGGQTAAPVVMIAERAASMLQS